MDFSFAFKKTSKNPRRIPQIDDLGVKIVDVRGKRGEKQEIQEDQLFKARTGQLYRLFKFQRKYQLELPEYTLILTARAGVFFVGVVPTQTFSALVWNVRSQKAEYVANGAV